LAAWVIEMGGRANTMAFPGSAICLLASEGRRFQSRHSFGCFAVGAHVFGRSPGSSTSAGSLRKVCVLAASVPRACGCRCALLLPARRPPRARMVSCGFPPCARVVTSGSFLRPVCSASRARPDSRGFEVAASSDFHGFGVERRSGFHGGRSN
jgi:hypothetical protein